MKIKYRKSFENALNRNINYYKNAILGETPTRIINGKSADNDDFVPKEFINKRYDRFTNNLIFLKTIYKDIEKAFSKLNKHSIVPGMEVPCYQLVIDEFIFFYYYDEVDDTIDLFFFTYNDGWDTDEIRSKLLTHFLVFYIKESI